MKFERADSVDFVLQALAADGADVSPLAGGTDVMVQMQRNELMPQRLVHIEPLRDLAEIRSENGHHEIGALVTHDRLVQACADSLPALSAAAATVGGWQTQAVGTIGGNVVNASPAADLPPVLLAYNARVELTSSQGTREIDLDEFLVGRRETLRRPDELLTSIRVDANADGVGDAYVKIGRRTAMEVAIVGVGARLRVDDGVLRDVRLAVAACGPRAFRARGVEEELEGLALTAGAVPPDALAAACARVFDEASLIDDVRASANYRRAVLPRAAAAAISQSIGRAVGSSATGKGAGR